MEQDNLPVPVGKDRALGIFVQVIGFVKYAAYLLGMTLLLFVGGHFLIGLVKSPGDGGGEVVEIAGFESDSPQIQQFHLETDRATEVTFEPYYHWKGLPSSGAYVNVDDEGNRRTVKSPQADALPVFCLGGSTLWGRGVPDQYTIPSILQTYLGNGYDLNNLAQMGFVTVQELNLLLEKLAFGERPEVVIFYDGVNDGYAGVYSPAIPRDPQTVRMEHFSIERQRKRGFFDVLVHGIFEKTNYRYIYDLRDTDLGAWGRDVEPRIEVNTPKTLDAYEEFVRQARGIAAAYDFKVFFFWQPNIYSLDKALTPYERQIMESSDPVLVKSQYAVYREAKRRFAGREDIFFLGDIFAGFEQEVYIDFCHARPRGNRMIAAVMFQALRDRL